MGAEKLWKKPDGESAVNFIRPSKLHEEGVTGVVVEGTFIEAIQNHFEPNKLDYKFEKEDGTTVILNGAGNLTYRMSKVMVGDYVQISYDGMQEIKNGKMKGRKSHNFSLLIAE